MATAINSIPILRGKEAIDFLKMVTRNTKKRASIEFKEQFENASKILLKSQGRLDNRVSTR